MNPSDHDILCANRLDFLWEIQHIVQNPMITDGQKVSILSELFKYRLDVLIADVIDEQTIIFIAYGSEEDK